MARRIICGGCRLPQTWRAGSRRDVHEAQMFYDQTLEMYAQLTPQEHRLEYALSAGNKLVSPERLIRGANFLRRELPVRLARTLRGFQNLPYIVNINPHVHNVFLGYWESFNQLRNYPSIHTLEEEAEFSRVLESLILSHNRTDVRLALGLYEAQQLELNIDHEWMDSFVSSFLRNRLSRRTVAAQHIASRSDNKGKDWVGTFHLKTSPRDIITRVMDEVHTLCEERYGSAPDYTVVGDTDLTFAYIPSHLEFILREIAKNSVRAIMESSAERRSRELVFRVCGGNDVTIVVQDKGGGIPKDVLPDIWSYQCSLVDPADKVMDADGGRWGLGFGLPAARVYAEYLRGSLEVITLPGYGTDVVLRTPPVDRKGLRESLRL